MNDKLYNLPYPKNLVAFVCGNELETYPDDFEASVQYVLYQFDEHSRMMLEYRYRDKMTLKQIGDKFGVSASRVKQILAKAGRLLRHPKRARLIMYGIEKETELKVNIAKISNSYELGILKGSIQAKRDISIDNLNINTRTYNSLARARRKFNQENSCPTVGEIIDYINKNRSFKDIPNCGPKTQREIIKSICDLGLRSELKVDVDKILGE